MHDLTTAVPETAPGPCPDGAPDALQQSEAVLDGERGDVPGWVLVTLMTAGLVVALWALAGDLLQQAFTDAINSVITGP